MDPLEHNARAWDRQVESGNPWTVPVSAAEIAAARGGDVSILLTPTIPVPAGWFPPLAGADVLGLAAGGGQQGPVLAAAGAKVVVFDNSPRQLDRDREVAEREGLAIETIRGDMEDLSVFPDRRFDLVVHPVSNCFVPRVRPVWREAFRVLRPGGTLLAGFCNPTLFLFDTDEYDEGRLVVRRKIPYADVDSLTDEEKARFAAEGTPFEWGHTLTDQIGGLVDAGFRLAGFYEDRHLEGDTLSEYLPPFIAVRALRPRRD